MRQLPYLFSYSVHHIPFCHGRRVSFRQFEQNYSLTCQEWWMQGSNTRPKSEVKHLNCPFVAGCSKNHKPLLAHVSMQIKHPNWILNTFSPNMVADFSCYVSCLCMKHNMKHASVHFCKQFLAQTLCRLWIQMTSLTQDVSPFIDMCQRAHINNRHLVVLKYPELDDFRYDLEKNVHEPWKWHISTPHTGGWGNFFSCWSMASKRLFNQQGQERGLNSSGIHLRWFLSGLLMRWKLFYHSLAKLKTWPSAFFIVSLVANEWNIVH